MGDSEGDNWPPEYPGKIEQYFSRGNTTSKAPHLIIYFEIPAQIRSPWPISAPTQHSDPNLIRYTDMELLFSLIMINAFRFFNNSVSSLGNVNGTERKVSDKEIYPHQGRHAEVKP